MGLALQGKRVEVGSQKLIGVLAKENERIAVQEFFELLKTPWEFYRPQGRYDVILSTGEEIPPNEASLFMIWSAERCGFDEEMKIPLRSLSPGAVLEYGGDRVPLYRRGLAFPGANKPVVRLRTTREAAGIESRSQEKKVLRLGIDLFEEISFLLTHGQPVKFAHIPTLEIYRTMIRGWILDAKLPFTEIPPVPHGYDFICCLTHDVDFAGIRHHFFDRTMAGFAYRALVGSLVDVFKGRASGKKFFKNWGALLRLPAVYLGVADDFWVEFDRFLEMEKGLGGTYFFLPYKNRAGQGKSGEAPGIRAGKYDLEDVREEINKLLNRGCEIGVHGIDAWLDPGKGRDEYQRINQITNQLEIGVRMHWLYFEPVSSQALERAGYSYDSTCGYNDAVGYRAGTTQVYRLPGADHLLELPLHLQDTALFYPDRMNLSPAEAFDQVEGLIGNAEKYGGVLTINWHHRSLGPERFWDDFYAQVLGLLKSKKIWFGTARQVVDWFRKRREISFDTVRYETQPLYLNIEGTLNPVDSELSERAPSRQEIGKGGRESSAREKSGTLSLVG
jgi:hypothetical protein